MKLIPVTVIEGQKKTEKPQRQKEQTYWINPDYIMRMTPINGGNGKQEEAIMWLVGDTHGNHIKETVEEIKTLLVS